MSKTKELYWDEIEAMDDIVTPDLEDLNGGSREMQYFEVWSEEEGGDENSELQLTSEGFVLVSVAIEELCQEILGLGEDEIICPEHNDLANVRSDLVEFLNKMARSNDGKDLDISAEAKANRREVSKMTVTIKKTINRKRQQHWEDTTND